MLHPPSPVMQDGSARYYLPWCGLKLAGYVVPVPSSTSIAKSPLKEKKVSSSRSPVNC